MGIISASKSSTVQDAPAVSSAPPYKLKMADVGSLFIKLRRLNNAAAAKAKTTKAKPTSPVLPLRVEFSSGAQPISHPQNEDCRSKRQEPVDVTDTYVCRGGVNSKMLLRATRGSLLETAEFAGANALINERWSVTISGPRHGRLDEAFKVTIHYSALAVHCTITEPHQPVALDAAKNVPGLMTIVKRNGECVR